MVTLVSKTARSSPCAGGSRSVANRGLRLVIDGRSRRYCLLAGTFQRRLSILDDLLRRALALRHRQQDSALDSGAYL